MNRGGRKKTQFFQVADRGTHLDAVKTVDGKRMILVAVQPCARTRANPNTKKTRRMRYIYHHEGSRTIWHNKGPHYAHFLPTGLDAADMLALYKAFVVNCEKPKTKAWLELNNYKLV